MLLSNLITKTPTTIPKNPYLNSATAGNGNNYGWIVDGIIYVAQQLFLLAAPVIEWGSKIIIVSCVIIYWCSDDKKYVSAGLKWFIIFLVYCVLRGAIG